MLCFSKPLDTSYNLSCCKKFLVWLWLETMCLLSADYLWIIIMYSFTHFRYSFKDALKIHFIFSRIAQVFIQVTFLSIMGINQINDEFRSATAALAALQMGVNGLFVLVLANN